MWIFEIERWENSRILKNLTVEQQLTPPQAECSTSSYERNWDFDALLHVGDPENFLRSVGIAS